MFEGLAEVVSNKAFTHDTWLMALRSREVARAASPGQFVMVRVCSGLDPLLRRPFSICGVREGQFLVLYRVAGKGTALMTEVREGERLQVLGPLGKGFDVPETNSTPLLVGGGIGVAPLVFLAQSRPEKKLTFMAGFRSARDILSPQMITGEERGIEVATDDGSKGHRGPVTGLLDAFLRKTSGEVRVYACGPKPMLRKVAEIAMARGIPCQVSLEANMACGLGICQGCAVKASAASGRSYVYVCKEGPVLEAEAVDWESL
jgi:dihydroorotate dehydrogenase electron transfer subunit